MPYLTNQFVEGRDASQIDPRQKIQKSQGLGPWLEMQQWEYSYIVSEANLELPHLKAEAMSSTKANSVIETLHSA